MHITPREQERLLLATAADLARRRLARGARLGATEAIAYICDEVCEMAWDGRPLSEVVQAAQGLLSADQLIDGVANLVPLVQVEALFPFGSVLVHVPEPFGPPARDGAGAIRAAAGTIALAPGRERVQVAIRNGGPRSVWVSSHFPLSEVNPALDLDRGAARGLRLDVPAGEAIEIPAGASVDVVAVRTEAGERS